MRLTIGFLQTDAMGITDTTWGPGVLRESLKFWFHATAASILLNLYDLATIWMAANFVSTSIEPKEVANVDEKNGTREVVDAPVESRSTSANTASVDVAMLYRKLLIDCCDLLLPGSTLNWIPLDPVVVGATGCISSLTSMGDIWIRVQRSAK